MRLLGSAETMIIRAQSLKHKFQQEASDKKLEQNLEMFATSLLDSTEIPVIGGARGPVGSIIHKLFVSAQKVCIIM